MGFRIYTGAGGRRFVGEEGQGELVEAISRASGAAINSNARDQAAAAQLHSIGLHTQQEVINLHAQGVPGFGPANPVNLTTHCRFNDGAAYRTFRVGARLPKRGRGVDTQNTPAFMAEANRRGFHFFLTYPGSVGERQHTNEARTSWGRRVVGSAPTLKRGSHGRYVRRLTYRLKWLGWQEAVGGRFGENVEEAVKGFQKANHLTADGVVGPVTWATIAAHYRRFRRTHKVPRAFRGRRKPKPRKPPKPRPTPHGPPPKPIPHQLHKGPVNGPDVSEHNGSVDWRKVAVGANEFAFIRVADGDHRDGFYSKQRVHEMRQARVVVGVYYYGRVASPANGERNGAAECDMALGFAREMGWGKPGDLPMAYDFEEANGQPLPKAAKHLSEFVARYHQRTGHWPIIYSMPGMIEPTVRLLSPRARRMLANCPLWLAYVGNGGKPLSLKIGKVPVPAPWKRLTFWQFSWVGSPTGVGTKGKTDMNLFNGNFTALLRLTIRR